MTHIFFISVVASRYDHSAFSSLLYRHPIYLRLVQILLLFLLLCFCLLLLLFGLCKLGFNSFLSFQSFSCFLFSLFQSRLFLSLFSNLFLLFFSSLCCFLLGLLLLRLRSFGSLSKIFIGLGFLHQDRSFVSSLFGCFLLCKSIIFSLNSFQLSFFFRLSRHPLFVLSLLLQYLSGFLRFSLSFLLLLCFFGLLFLKQDLLLCLLFLDRVLFSLLPQLFLLFGSVAICRVRAGCKFLSFQYLQFGLQLLYILVSNLVVFRFTFQKNILLEFDCEVLPLVSLSLEKQLSVLLTLFFNLLHDFTLFTGLLRHFGLTFEQHLSDEYLSVAEFADFASCSFAVFVDFDIEIRSFLC